MTTEMKFADVHNLVGHLKDPPAAHKEFESMIKGLNSCRISKALRTNPVICEDLIIEFWKNAQTNEAGADGVATIESTVKGTPVVISEQTIREAMEFGDQPGFPIVYPASKVKEALTQMCYEGSYPPTIKRLLPPFWRFLAHTFVTCVSGRKGGSDEISKDTTSAIVSLVMDWEYNFSKYVFEEMKNNLLGKKRNPFLMYPRFLQIVFDEKFPQLERSARTLDVKAVGPNTFVIMKQSRSSAKSASYQGLKELVKLGRFKDNEIEEVQVPEDQVDTATPVYVESSIPEFTSVAATEPSIVQENVKRGVPETVNVAGSSSEPIIPTYMDQVASSSSMPSGSNIFRGKDIAPDDSGVVDVVQLPRRIFELEQESASKDVMIGKLDIRVSDLEKDNSEKNAKIAALEDKVGSLTTLVLDLKQKFGDIFSVERTVPPAPDESAVPPAPDVSAVPPAPDGSADIQNYIATGPANIEEVPKKRRRLDEKEQKADVLITKNSDQKVTSSGHPDTDKSITEIGGHLSENHGDRTAIKVWGYDADRRLWFVKRKSGKVEYYEQRADFFSWKKADLMELIHARFYCPSHDVMAFNFRNLLQIQSQRGFSGFKTKKARARRVGEIIPIVEPIPDVSAVPPALDESADIQNYIATGPANIEEVPKKRRRLDEKKEQKKQKADLLMMKNSDQNVSSSSHADRSITEIGGGSSENHGDDRTGITLWGYNANKRLWVVKRKSGKKEYYENKDDFLSWKKVDLIELINAPFYNPSHDIMAFTFKIFLEMASQKGFSITKTKDSHTGRTVIALSLVEPIPDGSLDDFEHWVFDDQTGTVVLQKKKDRFRLYDPKNLLMFGEQDIKLLARTRMTMTTDRFGQAAKEFTAMAARIVQRRLWPGALKKSNVHLVSNP